MNVVPGEVRGVGDPGAGVTATCAQLGVGVGNQM